MWVILFTLSRRIFEFARMSSSLLMAVWKILISTGLSGTGYKSTHALVAYRVFFCLATAQGTATSRFLRSTRAHGLDRGVKNAGSRRGLLREEPIPAPPTRAQELA